MHIVESAKHADPEMGADTGHTPPSGLPLPAFELAQSTIASGDRAPTRANAKTDRRTKLVSISTNFAIRVPVR